MADKLLIFIDVLKQAQSADNIEKFGFVLVNQLNQLLKYKQALFWTFKDNDVVLKNVSGNAVLDTKSPYSIWLKNVLEHKLKNQNDGEKFILIDGNTIEDSFKEKWTEWAGPHSCLMIFRTEKEGILGGLWIDRDKRLTESENLLLTEIAEQSAHSLALINYRKKRISLPRLGKTIWSKIILITLLILFFIPTRLTITAPAEIISQDFFVVTAPFDGVLENVLIKPGESVDEGDLIAEMDRVELEAQAKQTAQALRSAQSSLSRRGLESLRSSEKKAGLQELRSEIELKRIDYAYAQSKLERSKIKANKTGVAIFSDVSSLLGQPVKTGEQLMIIANPKQQELLIRVPANDMIPLNDEAEVNFYLNTSPLNGYNAVIENIGYQASEDSDGLLTYKIRANLAERSDFRIGLKGTAKVKGEWSFLGYAIMRKPLITFRNILGV